jgi:hypothetical protein
MTDLLQQAMIAIRAGDKVTGKRLLARLLQTERDNEAAWLWLSAAVETDDERRRCLEQVLRINPSHPQAKAGLASLGAIQPPAAPPPPTQPAETPSLPHQSPFTMGLDDQEASGVAWEPQEASQPADLSVFWSPSEPETPTASPLPWETEPSEPSPAAGAFWLTEETETPGWAQQPSEPAPQPPSSEQPLWAAPPDLPADVVPPAPAQPSGSFDQAFWETPLSTAAAASAPAVEEAPKAKKRPPARGFPWHQIWLGVLISPSQDTYRKALTDPKLSMDRGLLWIFCVYLLSYLAIAGLVMAVGLPNVGQDVFVNEMARAVIGRIGVLMIALALVMACIGTLMFALGAGILHLSARTLGGRGSYEQLVFLLAAVNAPLFLVSGVIAFIPYVNCLGVVVSIYIIALEIIALKAVYGFGTGTAIAAFFLPVVVLVPVCCLLFYVLSEPVQRLLLEYALRG